MRLAGRRAESRAHPPPPGSWRLETGRELVGELILSTTPSIDIRHPASNLLNDATCTHNKIETYITYSHIIQLYNRLVTHNTQGPVGHSFARSSQHIISILYSAPAATLRSTISL